MVPDLQHTLGWRLTQHARERAQDRGFTVRDILLAAAGPQICYPCHNFGPDRDAHILGHLCVIVNVATSTVITVMLHGYDFVDNETLRVDLSKREKPAQNCSVGVREHRRPSAVRRPSTARPHSDAVNQSPCYWSKS